MTQIEVVADFGGLGILPEYSLYIPYRPCLGSHTGVVTIVIVEQMEAEASLATTSLLQMKAETSLVEQSSDGGLSA